MRRHIFRGKLALSFIEGYFIRILNVYEHEGVFFPKTTLGSRGTIHHEGYLSLGAKRSAKMRFCCKQTRIVKANTSCDAYGRDV